MVFVEHHLNLNFNKCFSISFGRSISFDFEYQLADDIFCQKTEAITDLGVIVEQKLNFNDHISSVVSKANRSWGFIQRHTGSFDSNTTRMLYFSFVKSTIMYASNIWRPVFDCAMEIAQRLERVNHRAIRYLAYKSGTPMDKYDHDYTNMAKKLNIPTIESSMKVSDVVFTHRVMNGEINSPPPLYDLYPINKLNSYPLRCNLPFKGVTIKSKYLEGEMIQRSSTLYNKCYIKIPNILKSSSKITTIAYHVKKTLHEYG